MDPSRDFSTKILVICMYIIVTYIVNNKLVVGVLAYF